MNCQRIECQTRFLAVSLPSKPSWGQTSALPKCPWATLPAPAPPCGLDMHRIHARSSHQPLLIRDRVDMSQRIIIVAAHIVWISACLFKSCFSDVFPDAETHTWALCKDLRRRWYLIPQLQLHPGPQSRSKNLSQSYLLNWQCVLD